MSLQKRSRPCHPLLILYPLLELLPQEAFGPHQENHDDDQKGRGILEGDGDIAPGQAFGDAQDEAALAGRGALF